MKSMTHILFLLYESYLYESLYILGIKDCILGPDGKPLGQSNDTKTGKPLGFPDEVDGESYHES